MAVTGVAIGPVCGVRLLTDREAAMTARVRPLRRIHPRASATHTTVWLDALLAEGVTVRRRLTAVVGARKTRARLGMLGVPLAMTAALAAPQWWAALPLVPCAWWWAPRTWGWEWIVAVGRGLIGAEWASLGANALAVFPDVQLAVGAMWAGLPAVIALSAAIGSRGAWV